MKFLKKIIYFFIPVLLSNTLVAQETATGFSLPLAGNAFSSFHRDGNETISKNGIEKWTNPKEYFTVYFRVSKPGMVRISIPEPVSIVGESVLEFAIANTFKKIKFKETLKTPIAIGEWKIIDTGYVALTIKGISKTKSSFPSISNLMISGSAIAGKTAFVPNNEGNFFYWGRRGPSVHLNYQVPEKINAEWYYNEITVPSGQDVVGSYYMANGFAEGYFGMQVNSEKERRILFSVWSPFVTDDPKSIPESHRIKLLKKGPDVKTGEFGSEGSGGQSYLRYDWIAGNTYKFLLRGTPQKDNTTTYTAYFFAPELDKWLLIASFNRPQTNSYLKRFHSFLENFIPEQGDLSRKVLFKNQWYCDDKGNWTELNSVKFTIDETGHKGYRMDYSGGLDQDSFYLKNGGFFTNYTKPQSIFTRPLHNTKPNIDFNKLP
ncbi:DUF3472 domain-containing protein [Flavobacterium sp. ZS1P14]|uniref:DUF3472 domain-containing protein n=1 Tax=Flavobacterium sp. ZS1P14 TaxID=3401729 RepID=UPI003AB08199